MTSTLYSPDILSLKTISPASCAVIIVTWNSWDYLFKCLDSLGRQTVHGFKVIVVDNGDSCPADLLSLTKYPDVLYIKSPYNLGFAAGNNLGMSHIADVDWVFLLNPDTVADALWFETMTRTARARPEFSIFGCTMLKAHAPDLLDGEGDCYSVSGLAWRRGMGLPARITKSEPWEIFSPCAAAAMYDARALRQVSGFDEDFFCYMEDVDLGFRLRLAGYRCLTVPGAIVMHAGSATTGKRSPFYIYHGQRNIIWTYVKNMPGFLFWIFLPLHIAINLGAIVRYTMSGQAGVIWRSKIDALRALPAVWAKRQLIQNSRCASVAQILNVLDKHIVPWRGRSINSLWK